MARLKEKYKTEIVPALMKEFEFDNVMQVPKLEKIVVNIGLGEAVGGHAGQEVHCRIQAA
jgi:large subunit ribosomal protein L5